MSKKQTFMFIYHTLEIGGIETYLIRLIRKLKMNGHRVIWLRPANVKIDQGFKSDIFDGNVEMVYIPEKGIQWVKHKKIYFDKDEEITALAFDPIDFLRLETFKSKYKNVNINSIYWVPHFKGKDYFIEEFVIWPFNKIIYNIMSCILNEMEKNNNIYYQNRSHAVAYSERYNYKITNLNQKVLNGTSRDIPSFNENLIKKRSSSKEFNIISVGRFEFPHKAYILGLIKTYGELKDKYSNLKLTIIGYGKDKEKVVNEINKLASHARKDVNLVGKVPFDSLGDYFKDANVNISVAGAICDGALTGLISIPVRHYCDKCEGYGYLPESKKYTTADHPGIKIDKFIEEVINMDSETYLEYSKKAYYTYASENTILSILNFKNTNSQKVIKPKNIMFIRLYSALISTLLKTKRIIIRTIKIRG